MIAAEAMIATPAGELPAGSLRAGDEVLALEEGKPAVRRLRWVGTLEVDMGKPHAHARNAPVRLLPHAIAPGQPARDVRLSPDHAILFGRSLIQAQALHNGATIAQDLASARVRYVHLELEEHGVLLAEALPVESYLDTGNRSQFTATRVPGAMPPDLSQVPAGGALAIWRARGCAPLRLDTAEIVPAHVAGLVQTRALGWTLTENPELAILADASEVPTAWFAPDHVRALLPAGTRAVRLLSRSFVPSDLNAALVDRRRLGIAVRSLRLDGKPLPPTAFSRGWQLSEIEWRWTDGDARLVLRALRRSATLELRIAPGAVAGYWLPPNRAVGAQ